MARVTTKAILAGHAYLDRQIEKHAQMMASVVAQHQRLIEMVAWAKATLPPEMFARIPDSPVRMAFMRDLRVAYERHLEAQAKTKRRRK